VNLEVQREIMWLHVGEEGSEFSSEKGEFEVLDSQVRSCLFVFLSFSV